MAFSNALRHHVRHSAAGGRAAPGFFAEDEARHQDTILDQDRVGVGGDLQTRDRMKHDADAVVVGLLRLQLAEPGQGGRRGVRGKLHVCRGRRDVGAGVIFFRQGRRAEAGGGRAADGDHGVEVVAGRDLAHGGGAEIAVVFVTHRQIGMQVLDRVDGEVGIEGVVGAAVNARVLRQVTVEGLGARAEVGARLAILMR